MKLRQLICLLGICCSLFIFVGCGSTHNRDLADIKESGKLVAGVKYDTNLFGYKNPENGQVEGFEIDLLKELSKRIFGKKGKDNLVLKEVSSKTRTKMLTGGDVDLVVATMTITDRRKRDIDFSDSYLSTEQALLVHVNSDIQKVEDVSGKKVAAVKGAVSGKLLEEKVPGVEIELCENYADAFTSLRAGKVDAITTDDTILMGMEKQDPKFKMIAAGFNKELYGIGVDKSSVELMKYINQFLADIWHDGTYSRLYRKWFKREPAYKLAQGQDK